MITGQMLSMIIGFIVPLLLVRLLSKSDYGLYAQFNTILSFCTVLFSFGLSSELYYSYPTANNEKKRILIFQSLMMLFIFGLFAVIILNIPIIKNYIVDDDFLNQSYIYLVAVIGISVPEVLMTTLYVLNHDNSTSATFLPLMMIIRVGLILLFYKINPTIDSVFFAILLSSLIKFIYVIIYAGKLIKKNAPGKLTDVAILKDQIKYTIPFGLSNSLRVFVQQIDRLILISFVSSAEYAIYSIAFYGVPGLNQVYQSISQVYIPRMSTAWHNNNIDNLVALYRSMVSKTLSYTIPIILIILLYADPIIPYVFSDKYLDSIPYFRIYLLTFIVSSIGCGNILRATGKTKQSLNAYIITSVLILPLTYILIKHANLKGAIIAAIIGAIFPKILLSFYDARAIKKNILSLFPWRNIIKLVTISLISLIPFVLIYYYIGHTNFWITLVLICVYLLLVFLLELQYKVCAISKSDIKSLKNKILKNV